MSARDWRAIVREAEGASFDEEAYTHVTYRFDRGNKRGERAFKDTERPNEAYPWVD